MAYKLVADVSAYQPSSLGFFKALKAKGVKAVIIKLTQGSANGDAYVNPKAKEQIKNAKAAGLMIHAYHYARFRGKKDAENEADWFTTYAKRFGISKNSVLALDIEDFSNAKYASADARAFLKRVIHNGYKRVDLYTMASWVWSGRINFNAIGMKLNRWIANYGVSQPSVNNVGTWQYTSNFLVYGYRIDMSYDFNGYYTKPHAAAAVVKHKKAKAGHGSGWHKEHGTFTLAMPINLRVKADTHAGLIATLPRGSKVKYDAYYRGKIYVWLRQPRKHGYGYLVARDAKTNRAFGRFK